LFPYISDPNIYLPKATEFLLLEALQKKVPVVGLSSSYTKAGAITAFDCDYDDLGKQAAELILKIINADPVAVKETIAPRKIKFSLNLKVAERLEIAVPPEIINEAGEVFGT
jgi:putative tryptophan/tyrosine transport system substrate-binding protein